MRQQTLTDNGFRYRSFGKLNAFRETSFCWRWIRCSSVAPIMNALLVLFNTVLSVNSGQGVSAARSGKRLDLQGITRRLSGHVSATRCSVRCVFRDLRSLVDFEAGCTPFARHAVNGLSVAYPDLEVGQLSRIAVIEIQGTVMCMVQSHLLTRAAWDNLGGQNCVSR